MIQNFLLFIIVSFKNGYRQSVFKIVDICVIAFVSAIIVVFAGGTGLKSFGMIMSIGSAVALFSTVVVTKGFLDCYTAINSTKPKRLNLNKEDKANA